MNKERYERACSALLSAITNLDMQATLRRFGVTDEAIDDAEQLAAGLDFNQGALVEQPIEMLLWCPECGGRHVDEGEFATKVHHTHACQHCGNVWRPAIVATCGVQFLPGFKNAK